MWEINVLKFPSVQDRLSHELQSFGAVKLIQ